MSAREYKKLRQELGRQKEVAERLGISCATLAHREGGSATITIEAALALRYLSLRDKYLVQKELLEQKGLLIR